jgi:hypothetical protein
MGILSSAVFSEDVLKKMAALLAKARKVEIEEGLRSGQVVELTLKPTVRDAYSSDPSNNKAALSELLEHLLTRRRRDARVDLGRASERWPRRSAT